MTPVVSEVGALTVSRETQRRLEGYLSLLRRWSPKINLVARSTLDDAWMRHVVDSAQLLDYAPEDATRWIDLGSGAGLPAMVLAIIAEEIRPGLRLTAVESDMRKAAFMREAARETGAPIEVISARIEAVEGFAADVVSARALAPLPKLLALAAPFLHGVGLFPKGARFFEELKDAKQSWRFHHRVWPSKTDPAAAIVEIGRLGRVTSGS